MKRAIVPIIIEDRGIKISNQNELLELFKNDRQVYNSLVANGDAQRMCFSYSTELPCNESSEDEVCNYCLPKKLDPFSQTGKIELLGLEYEASNVIIDEKLKLIGMHRHKTVISAKSNTVYINRHLSLCYMLLQDVNFIVVKGAKIRLTNSMLDNVHIFVEEGGVIELQDVEFSNINKECVYLSKGAMVRLYNDVRFFDVRKQFKIEYASFQNSGLLFNFNDPKDIISFLETSDILQIELSNNFLLEGVDIEFKQPIDFVNILDTPLVIQANSITTSSNLNFIGKFDLDSKIMLKEVSEIKVSFSNLVGTLEIEECDNLYLSNTYIDDSHSEEIKKVDIYSSTVHFKNVNVKNSFRPIYMADSILNFQDSHFDKIFELCSIYKKEAKEDDILLEVEEKENTIYFQKCSAQSVKFFNTSLLKKLFVSKSKLFNSRQCFEIKNCPNVEFTHCNIANIDNFIYVENSKVLNKNCEIDNGGIAFKMYNSLVELEETSVSGQKIGAEVNSGIFRIIHSSLNNNEIAISLESKESVLEHYASDTNKNSTRGILAKAGSRVIDLKEIEEMEKCQVS